MGDYTFISGATGGIGRAFCLSSAKRGYNLFITGRSGDRLKSLKEELIRSYPDIIIQYFASDLTDEKSRADMLDYIDKNGIKFERIINDNNLHQIFKYKVALDKMIITNHDIRIASFYDVTRDIMSENAIYIDFSDEEKEIYANIANSFMSVCPSVESTTKYKEDIDLITKSLNDLLQKSILEEYIQNNNLFIACFICPPYRYKSKPTIPVESLAVFSKWWKDLSTERKIVVLNNLWMRFDSIKREIADDLPF